MGDPVRAQMLKQIGDAEDVTELRSLRDQVHKRMEVQSGALSVEQLYEQINEVHDALIRRAIALAEAEMARLGMGSPPVPYAYLLFGSGGREEQTLSSDQDSGMIYGDPAENKAEVERYFEQFATMIVNNLQEIGYPLCEGNVISSNERWRLSGSGWRQQLDRWFDEADWESVRYLLIVADSRRVYGDEQLFAELKKHYFSDMLEKPVIVRRMLDNTMRHKVLLGIFGQLLKEQYGSAAGSIDIKYGAYIPMVNAFRMMAVHAGLRETSTLERIVKLHEAGAITKQDAERYGEAFRLFLRLRLMATEINENGLYANNGKLSSSHLSKELTEQLKIGLKIGQKLQRRVYKQTMGKLR